MLALLCCASIDIALLQQLHVALLSYASICVALLQQLYIANVTLD